jgi:hypothetical protein
VWLGANDHRRRIEVTIIWGYISNRELHQPNPSNVARVAARQLACRHAGMQACTTRTEDVKSAIGHVLDSLRLWK